MKTAYNTTSTREAAFLQAERTVLVHAWGLASRQWPRRVVPGLSLNAHLLLSLACSLAFCAAPAEAQINCTMTEVAQPQTDDAVPADLGFGWDADISGEWAIVGAGADDDRPSAGTGMAFIFRRDYNGTLDDLSDDVWIRQQQVLPSDPAPANFFGNAVAISGEYAVVGDIAAA